MPLREFVVYNNTTHKGQGIEDRSIKRSQSFHVLAYLILSSSANEYQPLMFLLVNFVFFWPFVKGEIGFRAQGSSARARGTGLSC